MIDFTNRVAIVTGAGNGLGRAYAQHLAARGVKVLVNNRRHPTDAAGATSAERTVQAIRDAGGVAAPNFEDVLDPACGERMVGEALSLWGRLDILVNNAGVDQHASFQKISVEEFRRIFDINFYGTVYPTHAAFGRMKQAGYGRIVTSTSSAGLHALHGLSAYSAAKSALIGLTRSLATEGSLRGVLVNAIAPYATTKMTVQHSSAEMQATLPPELVAPMVTYLVSAQTRVNGQVIVAGKGAFRRAVMTEGKGHAYREAGAVTPERIEQDLERILDMKDAREYPDALASFNDLFQSTPGAL
jgi:NAD(P)-dependent dehydrogenase (short-subunit alcohol dehydrogenase family)